MLFGTKLHSVKYAMCPLVITGLSFNLNHEEYCMRKFMRESRENSFSGVLKSFSHQRISQRAAPTSFETQLDPRGPIASQGGCYDILPVRKEEGKSYWKIPLCDDDATREK